MNSKARELGISNPQKLDMATLRRRISYRQSHPCKKGKTLSHGRCKDLPYKSVLIEYAIYYGLNPDVPRDELIDSIKQASDDVRDGVGAKFETPLSFPTLAEAARSGLLKVDREEDEVSEEEDEVSEEEDEVSEAEYTPSPTYAMLKKRIDADAIRDPRLKDQGYMLLYILEGLEKDMKSIENYVPSDDEMQELGRIIKQNVVVPVSNSTTPMDTARRTIQRGRNFKSALEAYDKLNV